MPFVQLDREFVAWRDGDPASADTHFLIGRLNGGLDWPRLLEHRRVVILAEAGSGKSDELEARAELQREAGQFAFATTVQAVARDGLPGCLTVGQRTQYEAWKTGQASAWFFIDSVDEAKLDNIRLDAALKKVADGIDGAAARAYIVLSGRYSDWEFRADLARLEKQLPIPVPPAEPDPPQAVLVRALRSEPIAPPTAEVEKPLVVLMMPLDAARVRRFAVAGGVTDADAFIATIEDANLWSLAARPLDLTWLVQYWRKHGRVGTLAQMLDTSLTERLKETNLQHDRHDEIAPTRAIEALERIGAALVFGRRDKITIPDSHLQLGAASEDFSLADILPDWTPEHRQRLLARAVFDPATFGHVRLHNDNQGVVRSYLAARWLHRRRQAGASVEDIAQLLFASCYGIDVIRPSMGQTAAWLSIWDGDVAREVVARNPQLLLEAGDPASLPIATRAAALTRFTNRILETGERRAWPDRPSLRRLASPDMVPTILALWESHKAVEEVRLQLLLLVQIGRLGACSQMVEEATFGDFADRYTRTYGVNALVEIGDDAALRRLAELVKDEAATLPGHAIWMALRRLTPEFVTVDEILAILNQIGDTQRDEHYGLQINGPKIVANLRTQADLEKLLAGVLPMMGSGRAPNAYEETEAEKAFTPMVSAAAQRVLAMARRPEVPAVAVSAALRLSEDRLYRQRSHNTELQTALRSTAQRRRAVFWQAATTLSGHPILHGASVTTVMHMDILGWSPGLQAEDLEWLLADMVDQPTDNGRQLAFDGALTVWNTLDRPTAMMDRIRAGAAADRAMQSRLDFILSPPQPTEREVQHSEQMAKLASDRETQEAERNRGWATFLDGLRANPGQLRQLPPPTLENIDGRLFSLWQLLHSTSGDRNHYGLDSVSALEPLLGPALMAAFRDALIDYWRQWQPQLIGERAPDKRNTIFLADAMGIAGVSIEAKSDPDWTSKLSTADAQRAAEFATLELNGLPLWIGGLSKAWPNEVSAVLRKEIRAQIAMLGPGPMFGVLQQVQAGPDETMRAVRDGLLQDLKTAPNLPPVALRDVLDILVRGSATDAQRAELGDLALERFGSSTDEEVAALYLAAAFETKPVEASEALVTKLNTLEPGAQRRLGEHLLPQLFGEIPAGRRAEAVQLPFEALKSLVVAGFQTVRMHEDTVRPSGEVYSPNCRDHAQQARSLAFNKFVDTPGPATFATLLDWSALKDFPVEPQRCKDLAAARASKDSEHAPWPASEAHALEQQFDMAPRTTSDLQEVAGRRLSDMQHSLLHGDFAQGLTFKSLPSELEVQKWIGAELRHRQARAYSVEREPHVADEKEPDVRLRAKASDASLAIEIKVAESWTLPQLEVALRDQLCGRYLRAKDARHGILLLVHQQARPLGWETPDGGHLSFDQVIAHLRAMAEAIGRSSFDAPQAQVSAIDVSTMVNPTKKGKPRRPRDKPAPLS